MNEEFDENGVELISFEIAGQSFSIPVKMVREIRGWTTTTAVPHSPDYVLGIINLRGSILPVVDLARCLGLPATELTSRRAIIVTQINKKEVGVLVESVSDIFTIANDEIQPPPSVETQTTQNLIEGVIISDKRLISLLDIENILRSLDVHQSLPMEEAV